MLLEKRWDSEIPLAFGLAALGVTPRFVPGKSSPPAGSGPTTALALCFWGRSGGSEFWVATSLALWLGMGVGPRVMGGRGNKGQRCALVPPHYRRGRGQLWALLVENQEGEGREVLMRGCRRPARCHWGMQHGAARDVWCLENGCGQPHQPDWCHQTSPWGAACAHSSLPAARGSHPALIFHNAFSSTVLFLNNLVPSQPPSLPLPPLPPFSGQAA